MYSINLDISAVLVWYILLAIGIIVLTLWAALRHKNPALAAWGIVMSVLILWLQSYLAPVVFGVLNYSWESNPYLFVLTGLFGVAWFGYIAVTLYNAVVKGELVA